MAPESGFGSEEMPQDVRQYIHGIKHELRERIGDYRGVFDEASRFIEREVADIEAARNRGGEVWPVIDYADIAAGRVAGELIDAVHRRGCAVIRGHFPHELARDWDRRLVDYLDSNDFDSKYRGPGDDFFGSLSASRPEIFPVYWSRPQMEARQHERMARVQAFLNHLWRYDSQGERWFDPDQDSLYPDRIRRRAPGASSAGFGLLITHKCPFRAWRACQDKARRAAQG